MAVKDEDYDYLFKGKEFVMKSPLSFMFWSDSFFVTVNTHIATPAPHATLSLQTRASGPEGPATVGNAPSKATGKSKSTLASQAQSEAPGRSKSTRASQAPRDTSGPPSGTGAQ